jgi:hypothetical protein
MKTTKYSRNDIIKFFAFCALLFSAIVWLLNAFNIKLGILMFAKDVILLIAISLPAYSFAKSLGKTWVVLFWIITVVFAVALVLGTKII